MIRGVTGLCTALHSGTVTGVTLVILSHVTYPQVTACLAALLSTGNTPLLTAALSSLLFVTLRASQRLVSGRHYRSVILTSIFKIKILYGQVSQTQLNVIVCVRCP